MCTWTTIYYDRTHFDSIHSNNETWTKSNTSSTLNKFQVPNFELKCWHFEKDTFDNKMKWAPSKKRCELQIWWAYSIQVLLTFRTVVHFHAGTEHINFTQLWRFTCDFLATTTSQRCWWQRDQHASRWWSGGKHFCDDKTVTFVSNNYFRLWSQIVSNETRGFKMQLSPMLQIRFVFWIIYDLQKIYTLNMWGGFVGRYDGL